MLSDYRRYTHYLHDNCSAECLRFAGLRQLLVQILAVALSLLFEFLNWKLPLTDAVSWNYFFLRGLLLYALLAVGLQANYAAAPLRCDTTPALALAPAPAALRPAPVAVAAPAQCAPATEQPAAPLAPELLACCRAWRGPSPAFTSQP